MMNIYGGKNIKHHFRFHRICPQVSYFETIRYIFHIFQTPVTILSNFHVPYAISDINSYWDISKHVIFHIHLTLNCIFFRNFTIHSPISWYRKTVHLTGIKSLMSYFLVLSPIIVISSFPNTFKLKVWYVNFILLF